LPYSVYQIYDQLNITGDDELVVLPVPNGSMRYGIGFSNKRLLGNVPAAQEASTFTDVQLSVRFAPYFRYYPAPWMLLIGTLLVFPYIICIAFFLSLRLCRACLLASDKSSLMLMKT
jgi:hypothetical protein